MSGIWIGAILAAAAAAAFFAIKLLIDLTLAAFWLCVGVAGFLISPFRKRRH